MPDDEIAPVLVIAARILGGDVELRPLDASGHTLRCAAIGGGRPSPALVVVKYWRDGPKTSFDPRAVFLNEWLVLEYLGLLPSRCAPQLFAADREEMVLVLEDIAPGRTLSAALRDQAATNLDADLVEWARAIGRLHVATSGQREKFEQLRAGYGATTPVSDASLDLRRHRAELEACLAALDVAAPAPAWEQLEEVARQLTELPAVPALAHFDAGPHNVLIGEQGARLIDFELAGFGDGVIDIVTARMAFPTASTGRPLPAVIVRRIEAAYQAEVAQVFPAIASDEYFNAALLKGCAHWAFVSLLGLWNGRLRAQFEAGQPASENLVQAASGAITRLLCFSRAALELNGSVELAALGERAALALQRQLPTATTLDTYPALLKHEP